MGGDGSAACHGAALNSKAVLIFCGLYAVPVQQGDGGTNTVAFLDPHFSNAAHNSCAAGMGRRDGKDRIFVNHRRRAGFWHGHAVKLGIFNMDVGNDFAA